MPVRSVRVFTAAQLLEEIRKGTEQIIWDARLIRSRFKAAPEVVIPEYWRAQRNRMIRICIVGLPGRGMSYSAMFQQREAFNSAPL